MRSPVEGEDWAHYLNSLWIENAFNGLRDNEGRGARHKSRSDTTLMGLVISNMASRFCDHPERLITVEDEDTSRFEKFAAPPTTFRARDAPRTGLGVDPEQIKNKSAWRSTSTTMFVVNVLALLEALRTTEDSDMWSSLWMAALIKHNMVLLDEAGQAFYVTTTQWTIALLQLEAQTGFPGLWLFRPDASLLRPIVTVTKLDRQG